MLDKLLRSGPPALGLLCLLLCVHVCSCVSSCTLWCCMAHLLVCLRVGLLIGLLSLTQGRTHAPLARSFGCLATPVLFCARHSHPAALPPLDDLRRRITPALGIPRCTSPSLGELGRGHSPAVGCVGRSGAQLSWRPVLSGDWLLGAASLLCSTLVISHSGDQPLWRSATLAISHSGDQPLWRSVALAISGDQPLWRSLAISIFLNPSRGV